MVGEQTRPVTRWRAEMNGGYWPIGFGLAVHSEVDTRSDIDDDWYSVGNYFATREQALAVAEWMRVGLRYIHNTDQLSLDKSIERLLVARKAVQAGEEPKSND